MAGRGNLRKNVAQDKFNSSRERNGTAKGASVLKNGDARLKIIQKNRSKMIDARDRLAQMAKKTDARAKLLKLRQMRKGMPTLNADLVQPVGKTILKKTDRNGKISLSTNKIKTISNPTDINMAIRKELGLITNRKKLPVIRSPKMQNVKQLRSSRITLSTLRKPGIRSDLSPPYHRTLEMDTVYSRPPPVIQRTIHNDIVREMPTRDPYALERSPYTWVRPESSSSLDSRRQSLKVIAKNPYPTVDLTANDYYQDSSIRSIKVSPYFIDDEMEDMSPPRSSSQHVKTGVHARLDTPVNTVQSQGIFSQPKTKVVVPVGHRIVVSNLQPTVTQDDIRELFEDIGELLVSRLVRPGTAEVIYKNLKDAQKAVDTYHNRQLDGQPMKCLLVNKRPGNNPTAPAVRTSKTTSGVLRTNSGIIKKVSSSSSKNSNKLIPDINTIHKVLFHK